MESELEKRLGWIVREPRDDYDLLHGSFGAGENLTIISHKDDSKIAPDAIKEHKGLIKSGDRIILRVADSPLRHLKII